MTYNGKPWFAVECKTAADRSVNPALHYFGDRLHIPYLYQISLEGRNDLYDGRVRDMPAAKFLGAFPKEKIIPSFHFGVRCH